MMSTTGASTDDEVGTDEVDDGRATLMDPETARHPQPSYKLMRDLAPVIELENAVMPGVLIGKHSDIVEALRNPKVFSSAFEAVHIGQIRPIVPLQIDPPEHHMYRK